MIALSGRSAITFGASDMRNVGRAFGALLFSLLSGSTLAGEEAARAVASAYNDFGQEIFASLEKKKGNIVYSPYSAGVAFSMAMSGASGATRAEFLKTMGFSQSVAEIESANGELALLLASYAGERLDPATLAASARIACLQKPNAKASDCEAAAQAAAKAGEPLTELNVANLLAIAKGPVSQGYKTVIAAKYGGEVFEDATPQRINAWAAEKTKGHVTHVVDWRPDEAPAFILADAVYFHGRWDEAFHAASTRPRSFTTASGAKADVATMQKVESLPYLDDEAFEIAWLPYRTEALGMMLVLPKKGSSPEAARARLVKEGFGQILDRLTKSEPTLLDLRLPRFSTAGEAHLVEPVKALGLRLPFDPLRAEFKNVSQRAEKGALSIDDVLQKTTLDVTEEGTLATAVTIVKIVAAAARPTPDKPPQPKPFYVDHPFLFFIVDRQSGAMLFEGRIEDPR
jgi:serpin B